MKKKISIMLDETFANKINIQKNKSQFANQIFESYYSAEKKTNDDIVVKLSEKISELENNIAKNLLEFDKKIQANNKNNLQIYKEIVNMLMQISYSTKDDTTIKNSEAAFDNLINLLKN